MVSNVSLDLKKKNMLINLPSFNFNFKNRYVGPQQQEQPGTNGTGCSFFYPLIPECPTQPRVSVSNIQFYDITMINGDTLPGVLLLDPSNPGTGFIFSNVTNEGTFLVQSNYICKNIQGSFLHSKPTPVCTSP